MLKPTLERRSLNQSKVFREIFDFRLKVSVIYVCIKCKSISYLAYTASSNSKQHNRTFFLPLPFASSSYKDYYFLKSKIKDQIFISCATKPSYLLNVKFFFFYKAGMLSSFKYEFYEFTVHVNLICIEPVITFY